MGLISLSDYSYKKIWLRLPAILIDFAILPVQYFIHKVSFSNIKFSPGDHILVVNLGGIGDIVLTEPLIRYLHTKRPEIGIDLLVREEVSDIGLLIPHINKIIKWKKYNNVRQRVSSVQSFAKKNKGTYRAVIDIKGDPFIIIMMILSKVSYRVGYNNGGLGSLLHKGISLDHQISKAENNLRLIDMGLQFSWQNNPRLNRDCDILEDLKKDKKKFFFVGTNKPLIVIHLGAGESNKLWPTFHWFQLINKLLDTYSVVVIGPNLDKEQRGMLPVAAINLTDKPLLESIAILLKADLFIGLDSGFTHLATAYSIPSICLFSLSHSPIIWSPKEAYLFSFTPPESLDLKPEAVYKTVRELLPV